MTRTFKNNQNNVIGKNGSGILHFTVDLYICHLEENLHSLSLPTWKNDVLDFAGVKLHSSFIAALVMLCFAFVVKPERLTLQCTGCF